MKVLIKAMSSSIILLVVQLLYFGGVQSGEVLTTTRTYDLEVPGSDPIRIIEGEPLWTSTTQKPSRELLSHRSLNLYQYPTVRPETSYHEDYVKEELKKFLNKKYDDEEQFENVELVTKPSDESKSRFITKNSGYDFDFDYDKPKAWDLLHFQKHKHPFEDKKGWVSLEPVPWSISKVSKWEGTHPKLTQKPDYETSWNNNNNNNKLSRPYETSFELPRPEALPLFAKPTATFAHKVQVEYDPHKKFYNPYKDHDENCDHHRDQEIITDGLPPNFPENHGNRRRGTEETYPQTHPFSGDGDWVLLSTTKGYKYPSHNRQRSLKISPDSIGAHRAVRLTVLPPLKDSKVNMTTSHGGLLQVESTFQTVEQAKNQYLKKQKQKQNRRKVHKQNPRKQLMVAAAPTVTATTTKRAGGPDTSAVLAAVGAGMIPATMAMLVPMAMGGRRRKRQITDGSRGDELNLLLNQI